MFLLTKILGVDIHPISQSDVKYILALNILCSFCNNFNAAK